MRGVAREYRISAGAIQEHYDLNDADMRRLDGETPRYRVGFVGWGLGLPFPEHEDEHPCYEKAVSEAKRVLAVLPRFREENSALERRLQVKFPPRPDKAFVYPNPFDCAKLGMDFEHSTVVVIDGAEPAR